MNKIQKSSESVWNGPLLYSWAENFTLFSAGPGANFFGDILQPQGSNPSGTNNLFDSGFSGFPTTNGTSHTNSGQVNKQGLVAGDLDASLANLTTNLNLAGGHGK